VRHAGLQVEGNRWGTSAALRKVHLEGEEMEGEVVASCCDVHHLRRPAAAVLELVVVVVMVMVSAMSGVGAIVDCGCV